MRVFNTGSVPRAALTVWCNVLAAIAIIVLCTQLVSLRPSLAQDASALRPGEGFITRFSGAIQQNGETVINTGGSSGSIVDLRTPGQSLFINSLAVGSQWRHCGIGGRLLDHAYERAKSDGYDRVSLHVWSDNLNAISFYEKRGFTTVGRVALPAHPQFPDKSGSILMSRKV